jgi:hypothetical protein
MLQKCRAYNVDSLIGWYDLFCAGMVQGCDSQVLAKIALGRP